MPNPLLRTTTLTVRASRGPRAHEEEDVVVDKKVYQTVDEYIDDQPEQTKAALLAMRECILKAAPDAEQIFNYDIPAFTLVSGGKREEQVMMAGYAKHVGFYPHPLTIEQFEGELVAYKHAKGSVQFPLSKPLPEDLIFRMVRWRRSQLEQQNR